VRAGDAESPVPACPGWRVRDVVAHLAGLCEDWVGHRLDGYASERWTSTQVSRFSQSSLEAIFDRWRGAVTQFVDLDDDRVMGAPARWAFGDAVTHEADIRGALVAGRVPQGAVRLALKSAISRWRHVLRDAGTPTLLLRAPDTCDWWLGVQDDVDAVVVEASGYEVFRALAGRRSDGQVRSWDWSADPEPFVAAGLAYPFHWSTGDIVD
jgi:uncharacterized protein (TIGR03083 family)